MAVQEVEDARLRAQVRSRRSVLLLAAAVVLPVAAVDSGPVLCPVRRFTGRQCPGCGMTRSVNRAMHGEVGAAVRAHPAGPALVGLLLFWAVSGARHAGGVADPARWGRTRLGRWLLVVVVAGWLGWAAWRAFATGG